MNYNEAIKAKVNKEEGKVSISVAINEDFVIVRKFSIDQFRRVMAHLNSVLYDIDHSAE